MYTYSVNVLGLKIFFYSNIGFTGILQFADTGWVVTWFLLGYTVRKNGGLLSTPMF